MVWLANLSNLLKKCDDELTVSQNNTEIIISCSLLYIPHKATLESSHKWTVIDQYYNAHKISNPQPVKILSSVEQQFVCVMIKSYFAQFPLKKSWLVQINMFFWQ